MSTSVPTHRRSRRRAALPHRDRRRACWTTAPRWRAHVRGRHALLVSDANVAPLYAGTRARSAACARAATCDRHASCCPPAKQEKTLAHFGDAIEALAALGATRDATVFALGGGVVGDLAGFAAACWMRGVRLRAAADHAAGDGGFLGRRQDRGRPAAGQEPGRRLPPAARGVRRHRHAAHPAAARTARRPGRSGQVRRDRRCRASSTGWKPTPRRCWRATTRAGRGHRRAAARTRPAIVARDPLEHGERALLNFGHTFGHAIETEQGYGGRSCLNHGEAVAVGMVLAARLSARAGPAPSAPTPSAWQRCWRGSACRPRCPPGLDAGRAARAHAPGQEGPGRRPAAGPVARASARREVVRRRATKTAVLAVLRGLSRAAATMRAMRLLLQQRPTAGEAPALRPADPAAGPARRLDAAARDRADRRPQHAQARAVPRPGRGHSPPSRRRATRSSSAASR